MRHPLQPTLLLFRLAGIAALAGGALLVAAVAIASARFAACGPSRLDALDAQCRLGLQLLMGAYGVLGIALVLGAASLTLLWRARRRRRRGGRRGNGYPARHAPRIARMTPDSDAPAGSAVQ